MRCGLAVQRRFCPYFTRATHIALMESRVTSSVASSILPIVSTSASDALTLVLNSLKIINIAIYSPLASTPPFIFRVVAPSPLILASASVITLSLASPLI